MTSGAFYFATRHRRSGQALLLVLLLMLALAGILALTVDFGFVVLARRQMQTGVNAASLEGLRGQGLSAYDSNQEQLRRQNARLMLRVNFDDDFDWSENLTTFGAGIDHSLVEGHGYRSATFGGGSGLDPLLANRSAHIFRPDDFQLNMENESHGDMIVGVYDTLDATHSEADNYQRSDFTADIVGFDSFLIRMRRTHNPDGLDEVPSVSSRGAGLPLILGSLSWLRAEPSSAGYSIRRDGVVVRATAISKGRVASGISPAIPNNLISGVDEVFGATPFIMASSAWDGSQQTLVTIDSNGSDSLDQVRLTGIGALNAPVSANSTNLQLASTAGFPTQTLPFTIRISQELLRVTAVNGADWTVERGVDYTANSNHASNELVVWHSGRRSGQSVSTWPSVRPPSGADLEQMPGKSAHAYLPLFAEVGGADRVIAFAYVTWNWDVAASQLTITPGGEIVGPAGVSSASFAADMDLTHSPALIAARSTLNNILLAPVHVRSTP